jgi:hypothetical protein
MSRVLERESEEGQVQYISLSNCPMFLLTNSFVLFRQRQKLVLFDGWLQNRFPVKNTAKSPMSGLLELLVCFSQFFLFIKRTANF